MNLPKVLVLNPRSVYNKLLQLKTFIVEHDIDVICLSESWEREDLPLDKVLHIENYDVISNPHCRKGVGGRPAVIVNTSKFLVENMTQTVVKIPWSLELVICVITPRTVTNSSEIKRICVISYYMKPGVKRKKLFYDTISDIFHTLSASSHHLPLRHPSSLSSIAPPYA